MKKRLLLFIAFIMTTFIINAQVTSTQTNCGVSIQSPGNECLLTSYELITPIILTQDMQDAIVACQGNIVQYDAVGSNILNYNWSVAGASSYSVINGGSSIVITWGTIGNIGTINLTVLFTDSTNCSASKNIYLAERPIIQSSSIPPYFLENGQKVIEVCKGSQVTIIDESSNNSNNITGYFWDAGGQTASTQNYTIEAVNNDMDVIHKVLSYCGCDGEEKYIIRVIESEEVLQLSCYGTVCEGNAVKYTALNANCSQYHWIIEGGTIIQGQNTPTVEVLWANPESGYGVLGLDGSFCGNLCNRVISVKIPIISSGASISGPENICQGDEMKYSLPLWGSTYYNWNITPSQGAAILPSNNLNEVIIQFNSPGTYRLSSTYTCEFLHCESITCQEKTIVVRPKLKISGNEKVCQGSFSNYTTNESGNVTWKLYKNGQFILSQQSPSLNYQFNDYTGYYITAENANYCNIADFIVLTNAKPTPLTEQMIKGDKSTCPNTSILLKLNTYLPNYDILWNPVCTSATPSNFMGNEVTIKYLSEVCPVNVYRTDRTTGCRSDAYTYPVSLFQLTPITTLPSSITKCPGSTINNLSVPDQEGVFYEWTIDPAARATVIGDKTLNSVDILVNNMSTGYASFNINLKRTYCGNISETTTIPVTVTPLATPTISFTNNSCSNTAVTLTATGGDNNPNSYSWLINGSTLSGNPASYNFSLGGNYPIKLTYTPDQNCSSTIANSTITIKNSPDLSISNSSTTLTAVINYDNNNTSSNSYVYTWTKNGTTVSTVSTCTLSGTGTYCCTVTNNTTGCSSSKCFTQPSGTCNSISITKTQACKTVTATANSTYNLAWETDNATITTSNNTHTASIEYNKVGIHTITVNATNSGNNCYRGQTQVTIPFIPDFELSYDCSSPRIVITDKSQYYPASNVNTRVLSFTITVSGNTYTATIGAGSTTGYLNVNLPSNQATYSFTLNYGGCTLTKTIDLYPSATITGITSPTYYPNLCKEVPFKFTANVTGDIQKYEWNFGDGATGEGNNFIHTYGDNSGLTVKLTVTDMNGCKHDMTRPYTIMQNNATGSLALSNGITTCPGTARTILYTPNPAAIDSYTWNPTKESVNTTLSPEEYNTYSTGDYEVKVISNSGCIGQSKINVPFLNKPFADIICGTQYCQGEDISISAGRSEGTCTWRIIGPNGEITLSNPNARSQSISSQLAGLYRVELSVSNGSCTTDGTSSFMIYPKPAIPQLGYGGNPCIHTPPVVLKDFTGRDVIWNIGIWSNQAEYYYSGFATAFFIDPQTRCKSDVANIFIDPAPNFDALLTGCYKTCVPDILDVYRISPRPLHWKWSYNGSGIIDDIGNSMSLPIPYIGSYELYTEYGPNGCNTTSPTLNIEQADACDCDGISITTGLKDYCYVDNCKLYYSSMIEVCNNSNSPITFDQLNPMSGINIVSTNVVPITINPGECIQISFDFEITDPSVAFSTFSLFSTHSNCKKDFSVKLDLSKCITDKCELDLKNLVYFPEFSSDHNTVAFKFGLGLPNNPSVVYSVWTEPQGIFYYNLNLPYIDGVAMFNYGELTQLVANGEEVCFYVLMCVDGQICKAKVCIKAEDLLGMSGMSYKSMTNTNTTRPNQTNIQAKIDKDAPYLVPNPADTYVKIEGIEKDDISEVFLVDISGKKLKEISNKDILDINDITSGIYLVRIMSKSQKVYYLKLIKK